MVASQGGLGGELGHIWLSIFEGWSSLTAAICFHKIRTFVRNRPLSTHCGQTLDQMKAS